MEKMQILHFVYLIFKKFLMENQKKTKILNLLTKILFITQLI